MAGPLARDARLRGLRGFRQAQVLRPRDVRVPLRARPCRPRPQLHDRRRRRAHETDARVQRPASVRLGCVRPAGRERRHQERHPSRNLDAREHRPHEGAAPAHRHQLCLGARNRHVPAGVLPLEPVAVPQDARAGPGVPQAFDRQLVPELQHGPRQRTGRQRRLLALRHHRHVARTGAVVLPDHELCRRTARGERAAGRLARKSADDAAQLDRPVGGRAREIRARPSRQHAAGSRLRRAARSRSSPPASTPSTGRTSSCSRQSMRSSRRGAAKRAQARSARTWSGCRGRTARRA